MSGGNQSEFVLKVGEVFSQGGRLQEKISGFLSRSGQIAFAQTIAEALENRGTVVLEAGTGTGKTFGYLVPVLLSGRKAIVSTAGKTLQEQLFKKDIPALEKALGIHVRAKLLKGRANYICLKRLKNARVTGLPTAAAFNDLRLIEAFALSTTTGDRSEVRGVAEDSVVWPFVTSTRENCNAQKCPYAEECFLNRARQEAKEAEVVVVNHHLFLSAMALKDEVNAEILPESDVVIFDEAHKLSEIGASFFSTAFSIHATLDVVKEIRTITMSRHRTELGKEESWEKLYDAARNGLQDFRLSLEEIGVCEGDALNIAKIPGIEKASETLNEACLALENLANRVELVDSEDDDLKANRETLTEHIDLMNHWVGALKNPKAPAKDSKGHPYVRWIENTGHDMRLTQTPLSFAEDFARMMDEFPNTAWIFTSATLATGNGDFTHFVDELGLTKAKAQAWESPFNFPEQALLYIPEGLPRPTGLDKEGFIRELTEASWPIIDLLEGKTLLLCTSREAMLYAADFLREKILANSRDYDVFVQGEDARNTLLSKFRESSHAILIATMGFWEGIDIKGEALSLVIIDKIPFAPKDDPVLEARCQWIRDEGGEPFRTHQIPMAAIALKQGVGRLIRSEKDRGVLIVGDTRIIPKALSFDGSNYGGLLLDSLPKFTKTRSLERVIDFWLHPETWG